MLYGIQFAERLGPDEVGRTAATLAREPLWDLTVDDEYRALSDALASGEDLDPVVQTKFTQTDIQGFLTRVLTELDDLRPWPDPALRELPLSRWTEFVDVPPIARIDVAWPAIQGPLRKMLRRPPGYNREMLLARLRSGAEVAFIWPGWADRSGTAVVALNTDVAPQAVIQEILSASSLDPSTITVLEQSTSAEGGGER
ncbi:hypothetical protein H0264_15810 [Nocardia huaxiensis]|uniref:Uncharacterized protein n=1 Tax=Nocardia huaxiensis TaxID=2755382 RepID=A0A7D6VMX9_9NOCA|nr:hypothetical protein [Nocardia huaxiensis]QLY33496.1 hypothetical protein H0264_15810 [Nocardia huaxiensis]